MTIIDVRKHGESIPFKFMRTGATFLNGMGQVCIKVSDKMWFNFITDTLVDVDFVDVSYELVDAELVLKDFKGEDDDNGRSKVTN